MPRLARTGSAGWGLLLGLFTATCASGAETLRRPSPPPAQPAPDAPKPPPPPPPPPPAPSAAPAEEEEPPAPAQPEQRFAPRAGGATSYGAKTKPKNPSAPLARGLARAALDAAKGARRPVPARDARLDALAEDVARFGRQPTYDLLRFLLAHHGIAEPEPLILFFAVEPGGEHVLLGRAKQDLRSAFKERPWRRVGVGLNRTPKLVTAIVALEDAELVMEPVPRSLPEGGTTKIDAVLPSGLADPQVIVTTPRGRTGRLPVARSKERFSATFSCAEGVGAYQIEVTASTVKRGPQILANFPVHCGVDPPASLAIVTPGPVSIPKDLETAARRMLELANKARRRAGLSPLAWDDRLAAVARAHSEEMSAQNRIGHVSPTTGTLPDRLQKAGHIPVLAAENLGAGPSIDEIHRGLVGSPGHRANLLDPELTHLGVGLSVRKEPDAPSPLYVTQVFARWK